MALKHKVIIGIVVLVSVVLYGLSQVTEGEYYRRFSPDGQYSIYVAKHSYFNIDLPFAKFGDNSGKVFLFDELNNEVVASSYLDMLSNINELFWSETAVYSKGYAVEIELPRPIDTKVVERYEETIPVQKTWNIYAKNKKYTVRKASNRLTVLNEKGDTMLQNIRYVGVVLDGFQVLGNRNEIVYYDAALNQRSKPPRNSLTNDVCDNVTTYWYKIEETATSFILKKSVGHTNYTFYGAEKMDSIPKDKVLDIYFLNKKRELKFNDNKLVKPLVCIDFGTYFGLLSSNFGLTYYDEIDFDHSPIKVVRNGLYGYYGITPTIYSELKPFEFNLAKFEYSLPSGDLGVGYMDRNGNTY